MHNLDRRKLLTSGAALAALAGSGVASLAAPKQGGLLRAAVSGGSPTDSFDPRDGFGLFMMVAAQGAVFETLTEVSGDGALRGEALDSWHASDGGRSWLLTLKEGGAFHDGRTVTARDVAASLRLHQNISSPMAPLAETIHSMQIVDDLRLNVTLTQPNPGFAFDLANPHLIVVPARKTTDALRSGIGSGPYKVEQFVPGSVLRAVKVGGSSVSAFDEIELHALPSLAARKSALASRKVDVIDLPRAKRLRGMALRSVIADRRFLDSGATMEPSFHTALHPRVEAPEHIGTLLPLDNGRIAKRWSMA